ncbi:MAG: hypothetical protein H6837_15045 [Planctomycetes bacterium]|nr:hypothetical protein [Planctomycetota bacterium]
MSPSDRERCAAWWEAAAARRGELPDELRPVQVRLVRAVARGVLPDAGPVFVKLMSFPRFKDRLRYALRSLPATHEARLLEHLRGRGVPVPEVRFVRVARRCGLPWLSMLATAEVPVVDEPLEPDAGARAVARLLEAGVEHPDLNTGNFLVRQDGVVVVLDLQSARLRPGGVMPGRRVAMVGKLFADLLGLQGGAPRCDAVQLRAWQQALVHHGVCSSVELDAALAGAVQIGQRFQVGRIRRCLQESTLFRRRRGLLGVSHERRSHAAGGVFVEGGGELVRYWIGDRALEILDQRPPLLGALHRPWPFLPRRYRVYVSAGGADALAEAANRLRSGHDRYLDLARGRGSVARSGEPLSKSS